MADEIDEIRARVNIIDLVEAHGIALKRSGKNYVGLCPFHSDTKPSFTVNPSFGRYKCWPCGEEGDIFNWVMKTQNVDFPDALEILAHRAGVTLQKRSQKSATPPSVRVSYAATMEAARVFFVEELAKSKVATDYCTQRGIDETTKITWELGFAPDLGEALTQRLRKSNLALTVAKELFLVDGDPSYGFNDKFKGRLIFPIRDERGELVAYGGRILGQGQPKYINSSDTPLYRKSKVLYGMYQAREVLMKERRAVLVEGYLDVIACHRAGVGNALASLGTALSEDHTRLLKRWVDEVTVLYDGDDAGVKAADRAEALLAAAGLRVRVAMLPKGEDPDTLLNASGPASVKAVVDDAVLPMDFRLIVLERRLDPSQDAYWAEVVPILATASSELELTKHLSRIAPLYPHLRDSVAAQKALRAEVRKLRASLKPSAQKESLPPKITQKLTPKLDSAELAFFLAYFRAEKRQQLHEMIVSDDIFVTGFAVEMARSIAATFGSEAPEGPPSSWLHKLPSNLAEQISSTDFDRLGNLTEELLFDAITKLQSQKKNRELKALEIDSERLLRAQERLKNLKPDGRNQSA